MHLFHAPAVDFLAREGQCLLIQSDEALTGRNWVEGWVAGEVIHVRIEIVEPITDQDWAPSWLLAVQVLRQDLQRPARKHLYLVSVRRPVAFIPLLDRLLDETPRRGEMDRGQGLLDPTHCREQLRRIGQQDLAQNLAHSFRKGDLLHLRLECQGNPPVRFQLCAQLQECRRVEHDWESEDLRVSQPPRYGEVQRYHAIDERTGLRLSLSGLTRG